jgi:hypothetical protein
MPDMERMMERMLEGLALLTQQVSRLAYAVETNAIMRFDVNEVAKFKTCRACQSRIQGNSPMNCLACGEFMGNG